MSFSKKGKKSLTKYYFVCLKIDWPHQKWSFEVITPMYSGEMNLMVLNLGYVLDGLPVTAQHSDPQFNTKAQLEKVKSWNLKPQIIIDLQVSCAF